MFQSLVRKARAPVRWACQRVPADVCTTSVELRAMMTAHRMTPTVSMRVRPTGYRGSSFAIRLAALRVTVRI